MLPPAEADSLDAIAGDELRDGRGAGAEGAANSAPPPPPPPPEKTSSPAEAEAKADGAGVGAAEGGNRSLGAASSLLALPKRSAESVRRVMPSSPAGAPPRSRKSSIE